MSRAERIAARAEARRLRAEARAVAVAANLAAASPAGESISTPPDAAAANAVSLAPAESSGSPFIDSSGRTLHLDNLYRGAHCFIVLSGPSIRGLDLSLLHRRGIFTFAVNNAPAIFRPNAWTHVDPLVKFHNAIWLDPSILKIVNRRKMNHGLRRKSPDGRLIPLMKPGANGQMEPVACHEMPGVIFDNRNASFDPDTYLPQASVCWGVNKKHSRNSGRPRVLNVMLAVVKHAYALGFRVVYLLGCDFTMSVEQPYAFAESKDSGGVAGNNSSYEKLDAMFKELRPRFESAGFHVFNCNRESGLTAFDHVNYERAIAAATDHVPQDPLDTTHWYSK